MTEGPQSLIAQSTSSDLSHYFAKEQFERGGRRAWFGGAALPVTAPSIEEFIQPPLLQQRLANACRHATRKKIIVGLQLRDQQCFAVVDDAPDQVSSVERTPIRTGCITKLLTN